MRTAAVVVLVGVALVLVIWLLPTALTLHPALRGADRHKAAADARTALVAVLVALAAMGTLLYTSLTYRMNHEGQQTGRFQAAAEMMGRDQATVRSAGLFAMAQLADQWSERRQECIDVICSYLRRVPLDVGVESKNGAASLDADAGVRAVVAEILVRHLGGDARQSWELNDFDFTGADLTGIHLSDATFRGAVSFRRATFADTTFDRVTFLGPFAADDAVVHRAARARTDTGLRVEDCRFTSDVASFQRLTVDGRDVRFERCTFEGDGARSDGTGLFTDLRILDGRTVSLREVELPGGQDPFTSVMIGQQKDDAASTLSLVGCRFGKPELNLTHAKVHFGRLEVLSPQPPDLICNASQAEIAQSPPQRAEALLDEGVRATGFTESQIRRPNTVPAPRQQSDAGRSP